MLRKMKKPGEQDNTCAVAKSNLFQWKQGISGIAGSINKKRIQLKNNQSDQQLGSPIVERNICNQEVGRRTEENNGLSTTEHVIESSIFYNKRSKQYIGNMEEGRLGMFYGQQIGVLSFDSDWGVGQVLNIYTQGDSQYVSGNTVQNFNNIKDLCEDNLNQIRWSEKSESSVNCKLCRRHSVPDTRSTIVEERSKVDSGGVSEVWTGDQ
ncbi:MAG: hypothetical protein EZS28_006374 [Streblomastix strix]|uniref:Uncharacterized protein n=1 Tax=Streblomastix strix TaxID=222440 RepID=A0A5J4WSH6_9EUKA|nr:MAG: hypothetical protein EZS28_006374 [Streblomastix strix]